MTAPKTILIIEDHPLFREGLKAIIARSDRFQVVAEAGTARSGMLKAAQLRPDIVIVDISLPDRSGVQVAREIRETLDDGKVLIVSMHAKIDYIVEAFQAGAIGYVVKESAAERLLQALEAVARGEYFLDSSISEEVVQRLIGFRASSSRIDAADYGRLTPREQEIMRLLADGLSAREAADRLCISPKTVENHRSNILRKLGLHSSVDLVRYAAKIGLIDVDSWKE